MLNRIVIFGWPFVALLILVPLLKALDSPPNLTVAVFAVVATLAGAIQGAFLDIPEKWLNAGEKRRSQAGES